MKRMITAVIVTVVVAIIVTQQGSPAYAVPTPDATTGTVAPGSIRSAMTGCLRSSGVTGVPDAADPSMLSDLEVAQQSGYGVSIARTATSTTNPKDAQKVTDCAAKVRVNTREKKLIGTYLKLADAMRRAGVTAASPDEFIVTLPGASKALADWKACTGRSYSDPAAAQADFERRRDQGGSKLQAEEKAVATSDVACRERVLYSALTTIVTTYIEQHS